MATPTDKSRYPLRISRRSIFVGAGASLLCAPALVRATSLMPVRRPVLATGRRWAGFCERLFYHSLDHDLRAGRLDPTLYGRIISEAEARRLVAYARANGWLTTHDSTV